MNEVNIQSIQPILEKNGVEFAGVFGSRARGEETNDSDIDILVRFKRPMSLSQFVRLKKTLCEKLKMPVDLLTNQSLSPSSKTERLRMCILFMERDEVYIRHVLDAI